MNPLSKRQKIFYILVAGLNLTFGLLGILVSLSLLVFMVPRITTLAQTLQVTTNLTGAYIALSALFLVGILNLLLSLPVFRFREKFFRFAAISAALTALLIGPLIGLTVAATTLPIYELTKNVSAPLIPTPTPDFNSAEATPSAQ